MNIQRTAGFKLFQLTTYDSSCKTVKTLATRLMQAKLDNQTTVPYTAYAASPGQLLSEKLWTVSATLSAQKCKINYNENDMNPIFELQKLISAQTLQSETKKTTPKNRVNLEVMPILSAGPFRSALSIIFPQSYSKVGIFHVRPSMDSKRSGWRKEMSRKSTMKSSLVLDEA